MLVLHSAPRQTGAQASVERYRFSAENDGHQPSGLIVLGANWQGKQGDRRLSPYAGALLCIRKRISHHVGNPDRLQAWIRPHWQRCGATLMTGPTSWGAAKGGIYALGQ